MELFGHKITNGQLGLAAIGLFAGLTVVTRMRSTKTTDMLRKQATTLRQTERLREESVKKMEGKK